MPALRRAWPWLVGGAALAVANAWLVFVDVNQFDESWTLQIVRRVADGEALYGDVHFGVTPLSIYLLWAVVGVVGQQILAVKTLSALLAAGSALLVARISLQSGAGAFGAGVCVLLTVALAPAFPLALYTPLAMFMFLVCESVALTASARRGLGWIAAAGGCAGLAFAAKQNVGGLAVLALVAAILVTEPTRGGIRRALTAVAAFSAVAGATVVVMVTTGGVRRTVDALGLAKGAYLELGAVPYHEALPAHLRSLARPGAWLDVVRGRDRDLLLASPRVILPVVAALLLAAAWITWSRRSLGARKRDEALALVTLFAGASVLAAFPRYEAVHLAWTSGPVLVACVAALGRIFPRPGRAVRAVVVGVAGAWAAFALYGPLDDWTSRERVHVGLPHFPGAWTSRDQRDRAAEVVRRLREEVPDRRVFIAIGNASFFYLGAELTNPTRYDFPANTTIGRREADEVLRGVADGTVKAVCLVEGPTDPGSARPLALERRLRELLRPGPDVGLCRLWFPPRASLRA